MQSGGDGAHGAVDRPEDIVGQLVGDPEEGMAGRQVKEVGVGAGEVGPHSGGGVFPVGAPVGIPPQALGTAVAGKHRGVDDPVAPHDGRSQGIGGDAVAQDFHHAGPLMAHGPSRRGQGHVFLGLVAAPGMQVGTADASLGHAQQYRPRLRLRDFVLLDDERLSVLFGYNYSAIHTPYLQWTGQFPPILA